MTHMGLSTRSISGTGSNLAQTEVSSRSVGGTKPGAHATRSAINSIELRGRLRTALLRASSRGRSRILAHPRSCVASDGGPLIAADRTRRHPHVRPSDRPRTQRSDRL